MCVRSHKFSKIDYTGKKVTHITNLVRLITQAKRSHRVPVHRVPFLHRVQYQYYTEYQYTDYQCTEYQYTGEKVTHQKVMQI